MRIGPVSVRIPRQGLVIDVDPVRLGQVIANLVNNAAEFTPPIDVSARRDGGDIVLIVRDNGNGIDPEWSPNVFDLFVQGRQASTGLW